MSYYCLFLIILKFTINQNTHKDHNSIEPIYCRTNTMVKYQIKLLRMGKDTVNFKYLSQKLNTVHLKRINIT